MSLDINQFKFKTNLKKKLLNPKKDIYCFAVAAIGR